MYLLAKPRNPSDSVLAAVKSNLLATWTNLRGWHTSRKLVVIESDDWGAIRMPGRDAFENLLAAGIRVDRSRYDSLDCLEDAEDFQALMNVIERHRDSVGRPAVFTFNTVMGNPDFERIENDDFECFHHQHLFDSYRTYHDQDLEPLWREAIDLGWIRPQLHAREHLNSPLWMHDLQQGNEETQLGFSYRFYGLKTRTSSPVQKSYLAACWPDSISDLEYIIEITRDGLDCFEQTFGYPSRTFIACNYVWPAALEAPLAERGVEMLQGQRAQLRPDPEQGGRLQIRRHYTGQNGGQSLRYSVRNVLFEPYMDENTDWANRAINEVAQSFRFNKPAVISTHRINYVSGMSQSHRDGNLKQLDDFLSRLRQRWPDVEFITSDELCDLMKDKE